MSQPTFVPPMLAKLVRMPEKVERMERFHEEVCSDRRVRFKDPRVILLFFSGAAANPLWRLSRIYVSQKGINHG